MSVVAAGELVHRAAASRSAVLAFNAITLEHAEAVLEAADAAGQAVILAISHNAIRYHGSLEPFADACRSAAEQAKAEVGLHLDHIEDPDLVTAAAHVGFSSVMFDASRLGDEANRRATAAAAAAAHAAGLWIESELGEVGGKDGLHAPGARTDPEEAIRFVERTGVDALAVAVGTSHAMTERVATVDLDLIGRLRKAVPVPLVLHGSSGVDDRALRASVEAGMTKINIGTRLNLAWTEAMLDAHLDLARPDPRRPLRAARAAMVVAVRELFAAVS